MAHVENLDMKEINHMPSKKDLTEAKIHHMLSEEMAKPQKHFRKLSYRSVGDHIRELEDGGWCSCS